MVIGREVENDSVKRLGDGRAKGENALHPLGNFVRAPMSGGMIYEIVTARRNLWMVIKKCNLLYRSKASTLKRCLCRSESNQLTV